MWESGILNIRVCSFKVAGYFISHLISPRSYRYQIPRRSRKPFLDKLTRASSRFTHISSKRIYGRCLEMICKIAESSPCRAAAVLQFNICNTRFDHTGMLLMYRQLPAATLSPVLSLLLESAQMYKNRRRVKILVVYPPCKKISIISRASNYLRPGLTCLCCVLNAPTADNNA